MKKQKTLGLAIIVALLFVILSSVGVYATPYNFTMTGSSNTWTKGSPYLEGWRINITNSAVPGIYPTSIKLVNTGGGTMVYIINVSNGVILESAAISSGTAYFAGTTLLSFATSYNIVVNGTAATGYLTSWGTFPVIKENITLLGTYDNAGTYFTSGSSLYGIYEFNYTSANAASPPFNLTVTNVYPSNQTLLNTIGANFNATYNIVSGNFTNATYYVYLQNGTIFNQTTISLTGNSTNTSSIYIDSFSLGNYMWNVQVCGVNLTGSSCSWALQNNSFSVGSTISSQTWRNVTYETANEEFNITINLFSGAQLSLANFIYNGTYYPVSNIIYSGSQVILEKSINLPLNVNSTANQTNNFYWVFTYTENGVQQNQTMSSQTQTVQPITFYQCNSTSTEAVTYINFTAKSEQTEIIIPTTFQGTFHYWLGDGSTYKNLSYNDLTGANTTFSFCFIPPSQTIYLSTDISYTPNTFSQNEYHISNALLTNATNNVILYALPTNASTKFYVTVKQGVNFLSGAIVNIQEYFIGSGVYKTVSIKQTDQTGQFPLYANIDNSYKFTVIQNGQTLGTVIQKATCVSSPCTMTVNLQDAIPNLMQVWENATAQNVVSNLSYDATTKIVTYSFLDTTGLAHYFRLEVSKVLLNNSVSSDYCNSYLYSASGSMTCNMTGASGDYYARGFISRSPEKLDKIISFVLSSLIADWGWEGLFACFGILVTTIMCAAVMSRGNPSVVLFVLGAVIIMLKIMTLFPFSWIVVICIELLFIYLLTKIKT